MTAAQIGFCRVYVLYGVKLSKRKNGFERVKVTQTGDCNAVMQNIARPN